VDKEITWTLPTRQRAVEKLDIGEYWNNPRSSADPADADLPALPECRPATGFAFDCQV
jgi:hypothetical protein